MDIKEKLAEEMAIIQHEIDDIIYIGGSFRYIQRSGSLKLEFHIVEDYQKALLEFEDSFLREINVESI
jgi:hypothetical protein